MFSSRMLKVNNDTKKIFNVFKYLVLIMFFVFVAFVSDEGKCDAYVEIGKNNMIYAGETLSLKKRSKK